MTAQLQPLGDLVQTVLAHEQRADARQLALGRGGVLGEEILRRDKAEHAVAQEFKALVAEKVCAAMLVGIRAVAQRLVEQRRIFKMILQLLFQGLHIAPS